MTGADVHDIAKEAIIVLIKMSAPLMLVALGVGLFISFFQAITQIQEMTLSFIPKILILLVSLIFFFPYLTETFSTFTNMIFDRMVHLSG